jgi:ribosomal protein L11 methyltransferase
MEFKAIHILCDDEISETLSFLLQENGYEGTSFEENQLIAYCKASTFDSLALKSILQPFNIEPDKILDVGLQNWNEIWESNFKEAYIGDHIHVRAPFHPSKNIKHDIIILPKMAFGTGHHETTQLSAIALEKLDCKNKIVLDMGCGSGLLAILASQKEAKGVIAIDYDQNCINNTNENIQLNKVKNVFTMKDDTLSKIEDGIDIIVSNIVKNINLKLLPQFADKLTENGILILCGFLTKDFDNLIQESTKYGFSLTDKNTQNGWLQTQFIKKNVD